MSINVTATSAVDDNQCLMSFAVSGATTVAATDTRSLQLSERSQAIRAGATYLVTGLTAGSNTFTAQYRSENNGSSCSFANRNIVVVPWPN